MDFFSEEYLMACGKSISSATRRYVPTSEMVKSWRSAWDDVGGTNPYSMRIDRLLREGGFGIHDIKTRIGLIRAKRDRERTQDEADLLSLDDELRFMSEQGLFDKCTESTNGAIFLLESKYGYRKGQDLTLQVDPQQVKKVVRWGDEEVPEAPQVMDTGKQAAEG